MTFIIDIRLSIGSCESEGGIELSSALSQPHFHQHCNKQIHTSPNQIWVKVSSAFLPFNIDFNVTYKWSLSDDSTHWIWYTLNSNSQNNPPPSYYLLFFFFFWVIVLEPPPTNISYDSFYMFSEVKKITKRINAVSSHMVTPLSWWRLFPF